MILLVALIPAVMFLRGLFTYLNNYFLQWAAIRAITDLRVKLFAHLMNLPAGFFSGTNTGELMSRIMNDTAALQNIMQQCHGDHRQGPGHVAGTGGLPALESAQTHRHLNGGNAAVRDPDRDLRTQSPAQCG